jgi:hypothetical protein
VKEWVGHSNLQTTSLYTHFQDDFRQRVASGLGLFAQEKLAMGLPVSPNSPSFPQIAASA